MQKRMNAIVAGALTGKLCLVGGTIISTNEKVGIICIETEDDDGYQLHPLGHLCNEDPYSYYIPDLITKEETKQ